MACWSVLPVLVLGWFLAVETKAEDSPRQVKESENATIIRDSLQKQYATLWESMSPDAKSGYFNLVDKVYLPSDFDEDILKSLDGVEHAWPIKDVALVANERASTWAAYGLSPRPNDPTRPLQYVVTEDKRYVMNCFACHGGNLYGATYPGAPNTSYALESLTEQVRRIKLSLNKPLTHMDVGSVFMPLGRTVGSSNAVMFGVALMNYRDKDLNVHTDRIPPPMLHHDMDAPPWWHFHRKQHIYIDGFAEKGHRGLMQFMLVRQNGPDQFKAWEKDFRQVFEFISALRPPKYPLPIDQDLAEAGQRVFLKNCAECHGTYGPNGRYPEQRVSIEEVGTDRVRGDALTARHREQYARSWFADYGKQQTLTEVDGYVAPPLDGIWASAPYFHNGSVPTLWHVLHPESRPSLWRRTGMSLDTQKMGLMVDTFQEIPRRISSAERRWYFDTRQEGKSAQGHDYPKSLTESEKEQLLEYLKTL